MSSRPGRGSITRGGGPSQRRGSMRQRTQQHRGANPRNRGGNPRHQDGGPSQRGGGPSRQGSIGRGQTLRGSSRHRGGKPSQREPLQRDPTQPGGMSSKGFGKHPCTQAGTWPFATRSKTRKYRPFKTRNRPFVPKPDNRPKRHLADYSTRLNRPEKRIQFYKKIRDQLNRRIPPTITTVDLNTIDHIWKRHGCYQNAKHEERFGAKDKRGKMPSYFRNHRTLVSAVSATLRPNWTRTAVVTRKGRWRFKHPKLGYPAHGYHGLQPQPTRRFYFKRFKEHIGYSGRGYGYRGSNATNEGEECFCCAVLMEGKKMITAFPMLTMDAHRQGTGPKSVVSDVVDTSTFNSNSDISSSESIELDEAQSTDVPTTSAQSTVDSGTGKSTNAMPSTTQTTTTEVSDQKSSDDEKSDEK